MILGLEDIPGGNPIFSFFIWLFMSGLYYLVCYLAVLNVLDDLTKNSWVKIPTMLVAAIPSAGLMTVFNYKPFALVFVISIANYYRVKNIQKLQRWKDFKINTHLFYCSSYAYIISMMAFATYFQPMDFSK